jgi:hypothetical protein
MIAGTIKDNIHKLAYLVKKAAGYISDFQHFQKDLHETKLYKDLALSLLAFSMDLTVEGCEK